MPETRAKQTKNEKSCLLMYEDFKAAGTAARILGLNRNTVERYYQKFAAKEITTTNEQFIQRQRAVKSRVLEKIDGVIAKCEAQIKRVELEEADYSPEGINMERLLQKSIIDLNSMLQQKADIEMMPTLDIHIDAEIEKKFGNYNEANSITKQTGKSKGK